MYLIFILMEISLFKFKFKNKQEQYNELLLNPKEYLDKRKKALRGIKVKNLITFRHVKVISLLNFSKQMAALIQAGFSLKRGLDVLVAQQDQDMEFKTVLNLMLYNERTTKFINNF
ncbi:MAG: hypothetical protein HYU63_04840 [Armatimonadetes bacterium]|nr:hypothetical protein [Armatimonadota bacterium]